MYSTVFIIYRLLSAELENSEWYCIPYNISSCNELEYTSNHVLPLYHSPSLSLIWEDKFWVTVPWRNHCDWSFLLKAKNIQLGIPQLQSLASMIWHSVQVIFSFYWSWPDESHFWAGCNAIWNSLQLSASCNTSCRARMTPSLIQSKVVKSDVHIQYSTDNCLLVEV